MLFIEYTWINSQAILTWQKIALLSHNAWSDNPGFTNHNPWILLPLSQILCGRSVAIPSDWGPPGGRRWNLILSPRGGGTVLLSVTRNRKAATLIRLTESGKLMSRDFRIPISYSIPCRESLWSSGANYIIYRVSDSKHNLLGEPCNSGIGILEEYSGVRSRFGASPWYFRAGINHWLRSHALLLLSSSWNHALSFLFSVALSVWLITRYVSCEWHHWQRN